MITKLSLSNGRSQEGSVIIIVMVFTTVFLIIGSALFLLVRSSNSGTALERKDVKAFNVAEAGVDAAMVDLKVSWPRVSTDNPVIVDPVEFRNIYSSIVEFPNPSHGTFISAVTRGGRVLLDSQVKFLSDDLLVRLPVLVFLV